MKITKGQMSSFLITIIIFGLLFLYYYSATMQVTEIYDLKNKTKEVLGKNVYKAIYSEDEKYIGYIHFNGVAKVISRDMQDVFSEKEINDIFFSNGKTILTDKSGKVKVYSNNKATNLPIDTLNKTVFVLKDNLIVLDNKTLIAKNLSNQEKTITNRVNLNFKSKDDISKSGTNFVVCEDKKATIFDINNLNTPKTINIDYKELPAYSSNLNLLAFKNTKDLVSVYNIKNNSQIAINQIKNPHTIFISDKNKYIVVANDEKLGVFDTTGKEIYIKDLISSFISISNKEDKILTAYKKGDASIYDLQTGKELFAISGIRKGIFSPKDDYIIATKQDILK